MERLNDRRRSLHLDLLKWVAMRIMPALHAAYHLEFEGFFSPVYPAEAVSALLGILYNFVPGAFLFCLGCGVVLTRHGEPRELAERGGKLILLGLALNMLRFTPFYLLKGFLLLDMAGFSRAWLWIVGSDVLPFAGLSFLVFAFARRHELPDWVVLGFGVFCAAGQMLLPVPFMTGMLGHLLGNFLFVDGGASYFPFLSWIIFPCLGYFYQSRLGKSEHPARFHLILGLSCAALLTATVAVLKRRGQWRRRYLQWGEMEFRMDFPTAWIVSLITGIWLSIAWFLSSLVKGEKLRGFISACARLVTSFYCVHWLVLMYGLLFRKLRRKPGKIHSAGGFLAVCAALTVISALVTKLWSCVHSYRKDQFF
ncbi:MAG: hypothetical protein IJV64_07500 [Oscillospiraceae bacterium]|nr:hypothetical protein [Oscillospiraceae bacterium]